MQAINIEEILEKYKNNLCTEEEIAFLHSWYLNYNKDLVPRFSEQELLEIEREIKSRLDSKVPVKKLYWTKIVAVAAILLACLGVGLYFVKGLANNGVQIVANQQDVLPGRNKATLTLASGKVINLEKESTGLLAKEGAILIKKNKDGQIIYDLSAQVIAPNKNVAFNVIQTPRAGTYQITLPDGTVVWLNSASKLKFPSNFVGKERNVELAGEAYFEVAENRSKPFRVISSGQVVEVLGTHFNINTYSDEPLKETTLIKGSVKVSSGNTDKIIKPGEQFQISANGNTTTVKVDTDPITAWKDGVFSFKKADLKTVMRQIARWYDVDVEYGSHTPSISFTGKIYRNVSLQEALKSIGYLDVKYTLKDRLVSFNTEKQ